MTGQRPSVMVQTAPKAELELKVKGPTGTMLRRSAADFTAGYHGIPGACPAPGVSHLNQESGHLQDQAGEQHRMPGSNQRLSPSRASEGEKMFN